MRHFVQATGAPGALTCGMPAGAPVAALVTFPGSKQRLAPAHPSTGARTIAIPAVTTPADSYLSATMPALIEAMGLSVHRALSGSKRDWTTPCNASIKRARMRTFEAALACRRPGVLPRECARAFAFSAWALRYRPTRAVVTSPKAQATAEPSQNQRPPESVL
jgi:hypothetical protein